MTAASVHDPMFAFFKAVCLPACLHAWLAAWLPSCRLGPGPAAQQCPAGALHLKPGGAAAVVRLQEACQVSKLAELGVGGQGQLLAGYS